MANSSALQHLLYRDGSSQAARVLAALGPEYISVDERSLKDLLVFAREYAKELRYYNSDHQAMGDWSAFLSPDLDLDEVVAFMRQPDSVPPERARLYSRPHLALFLTFLHLLRHAQDHLNTLTRRHLDFYYQQVLRMTQKPSVADQVILLIDLVDDTEQFLLPAGTELYAGADSLGEDLFYHTDQDIVVNHAQVAQLSSVHADQRLTGIQEARERHDGPKDEGIMMMLRTALGDPLPGDELPPYTAGESVDYAYLVDRYRLLQAVEADLAMDFAEYRGLMRFKLQRDQADAEWNEINQLLEKAARRRTTDPNWQLQPADPRDFAANLAAAMGGPPNFDGIPEVEDIYDLYDQRIRQDVQAGIRERLYFDDLNDFFRLMQLVTRINNEWQGINRLLEQAGQKKRDDSAYTLPISDRADANFDANLNAAVGPVDDAFLAGVRDIDAHYEAFLQVERYFFMPAENFAYLMSVAEADAGTVQEWNRVYDILAEAHTLKVYAARRARLQVVRETRGFNAMLSFALGEAPSSELTPLERLLDYVRSPLDAASLEQIGPVAEAGAVTDAEWRDVYRMVELAQRVRENLSEPVALKEEWLNLYPTEDAATITVELGIEADAVTPHWRTFGEGQPTVSPDTPPPLSFGWAISSPLLALAEGHRTLTLTLGFQSELFQADAIEAALSAAGGGPFHLEISTENGWIEPDTLDVRLGDYPALSGIADDNPDVLPALELTLNFAENIDALAPLPEAEAQIDSPWPVLRLRLRQLWHSHGGGHDTGRYLSLYQPFKGLVLVKTHLKAEVTGLIPLLAQNDGTTLNAKNPFEPFGLRPAIGSRFYLCHPEIVYQPLDRLTFQLEWMGAPSDLATHYANYDIVTETETETDTVTLSLKDTFTARISLIDKRLDLQLDQKAELFDNTDATAVHTIDVPDVPDAIETGRPGSVYARTSAFTLDDDLLDWNRYVQWELNAPDFQHAAYPALTTRKSIDMAAALAAGDTDAAKTHQVNPPYTPKLKSLSLSYTASAEILMADYRPESHHIDRLFHIEPFGVAELLPDLDQGPQSYPFLPQYNHEGELYIGVENVHPPQNLSLLFQMAEGSADPDLPPTPVQWRYLSGNRWLSLEDGNLLLDTTGGLMHSGIITFALEPAQPNTLLPAHLYWLRAAIPQYSTSVCATVAIHTQAVSATFVDNDNAPDHLSQPLAAGSITDLATPLPEIIGLRQPYTSYGGKMAEQDQTFYTRLSERLRHKHRALSLWDYEHLILERFPEIYKVKCLPAGLTRHRGEGPSDKADQAADELGRVEIVVIPDIRNKLPFNPFEPKAPTNLLADIEAVVAANSPLSAMVRVKNAHYVQVKLRFAVRFLPGYNEGYFKQYLNDELNRFMSPWAFEEGAEIEIGGRIYANVIINFIEERPYVDYVAEVKLFSSEDGITFSLVTPSVSEGYWVQTDRPDGVLVAARQHAIDLISEAGYEEAAFTGLDYMQVELDFSVG